MGQGVDVKQLLHVGMVCLWVWHVYGEVGVACLCMCSSCREEELLVQGINPRKLRTEEEVNKEEVGRREDGREGLRLELPPLSEDRPNQRKGII